MQGLADVIRVVNSLKCDIGYVKRKLKEIIDSGAGQPGADGREIELQSTSTELQWRYVGDATWQTLATFAQIGAGLPFVGLTGNEDVNGVKTLMYSAWLGDDGARAAADNMFYDNMRAVGIPKWQAKAMFWAVRAFGKKRYGNDSRPTLRQVKP